MIPRDLLHLFFFNSEIPVLNLRSDDVSHLRTPLSSRNLLNLLSMYLFLPLIHCHLLLHRELDHRTRRWSNRLITQPGAERSNLPPHSLFDEERSISEEGSEMLVKKVFVIIAIFAQMMMEESTATLLPEGGEEQKVDKAFLS